MAKKRRRPTKKKQHNTPIELIAVILFIVALFALFSFGFIGIFIGNIIRLIVGDAFRLFSIGIMAYAGMVLFRKSYRIPLTLKWWLIIACLTFVSFTLLTLINFNVKETMFAELLSHYKQDFFSNTQATTLGGGLIGTLFANIALFLFGLIGTYIVLVLVLGICLMILMDVTLADIGHFFVGANRKIGKKMVQVSQSKLLDEDQETSELIPVAVTSPVVEEVKNDIPVVIQTFKPEVKEEEPVQEEPMTVSFNGDVTDEQYTLPPITLLKRVEVIDQSSEHALIQKNSRVLEDTFRSFGVNAKVISAHLGPSVTKFEVQPAVGVKVSKIVNLTDDLALALAAKDIRIEAPIPGKSFIGIEVPNQTISTVSFREIIEGNIDSASKLEVPLGRDISGNIRMADLSKMPHLLVAGATGSGKSVAINGMITSILMKAKPSEVKLMMIDPKKVELNVYNGIPHLLTPVVTNPRRAAQALQKVVTEMERRYEVFAQTGMRNITGYNDLVEENNQNMDNPALQKMPYIVVIVDELADLMMVASNEVESAIIRLAQMARAAGIHMVLATQRPSVDVITGLIKANVPSRMAFAVSSSIDSRTIIDSNGAEKLLGKGDMLFQPMGENKPIRVQGAYLSDQEVEKVVSFVKEQQEANYVEDMMPSEEDVVTHLDDVEDDLFGEVVAFLQTQEFISVSMLQRRFRVGFNRASRLMETLEAREYVGPAEGTKPRKVLQKEV